MGGLNTPPVEDKKESNRDTSRNVRMGVVIGQVKVIVLEVEEAPSRGIQLHVRQGAWRARKLQAHLLQMIPIDMRIAKGVDKITHPKPDNLRRHHKQ